MLIDGERVVCDCGPFAERTPVSIGPGTLYAPYPEQCAGDALVTVAVSVGPGGDVKKAWVVNSQDSCFNEAALDAAARRRFPFDIDADTRTFSLRYYFTKDTS